MNTKVQKILVQMSKCALYYIVFQLSFYTLAISYDIEAQNKSLKKIEIFLGAENATLNEVFHKIEELTDFTFAYLDDELPNEMVTLPAKRQSAEKLLRQIAYQAGVAFRRVGLTIHVKPRSSLDKYAVQEEHTNLPRGVVQYTVTGKVTDENGNPLPGATVLEKGTANGVVTGADGQYTLNVSDENAVLSFSFVGYMGEEIPLQGRARLDVSMVPDLTSLQEIVVVGYGTQERKDLTGAVSSVQEEDFTQGITNSALQLLNGRAAGVFVSQSSSAPGGGISVRVRGAGSINSNNDVLIVVDGLPGAPTQALSPEDIESIEVLKDASAAAIYGTRAANGVILITTKKGQNGKVKVDYSGYIGTQEVAERIDMLSARDYMQVLNELLEEQGDAPRFTQEEINAIGDGTDWQEEVFQTAIAQSHQVSISGGSEKSNYYVGINYLNQDGIVEGSSFQRYNLRFNQEVRPVDKLKLNFNLNFNRNVTESILSSNAANESAGPINTAIQFDPTISTALDENGFYPRNPLVNLENPLALVNGVNDKSIVNRAFGTISTDYELVDGLTATVRLGIDLRNARSDFYNSRLTTTGRGAGGIGEVTSQENNHWLAEFFGTYKRTFREHHNLTVLGGFTLEEFDNRRVVASSRGFISDVTGTNLLQSGDGDEGDNVESGRNINRLNSFIGRINYTLFDKYLLTASVRADGTSRFAEGNKYAVFPSVALAWRISDESFFPKDHVLHELKLRAGYGQLGNQGINNFETIQTFRAAGNAVLGDGLIQGVAPARIPNNELQWETSEEFNFGLDFALFAGRLSGSVDYFIKNTKDQLFNRPVPATTGFSSVRVNFGEVRNTGLELFLESVNVDQDLKWTTTLTMATLKNEVRALPEFTPEIISGNIGTFTSNFLIVREGEPLRSFYGYEITGIFQEGDDIANSAQPDALPGHPIYRDLDNDGAITSDDRVVLGKPLPDLTFGINNSFRYKGFGLDIFFIGVRGIEALNNNILESLFPINFDRNRISEHYLNRWTPGNPNAEFPSGVNPSSYGGGRAVNSLTVSDASFFRLKTVTLSYEVPVADNLKFLDRLSVYLAGDNLFTITDFVGYDPDANAGTGGDNPTLGIAKTSYNSYPLNRTFRLGAKIGF